jgi:predicted lipid carrier protein YhbT
VFQLQMRGGRCKVRRRRLETARVLIECDDMPFLKLVAGAASGPDLFMRKRLDIDGDLLFAMRLPALFRVPRRKG